MSQLLSRIFESAASRRVKQLARYRELLLDGQADADAEELDGIMTALGRSPDQAKADLTILKEARRLAALVEQEGERERVRDTACRNFTKAREDHDRILKQQSELRTRAAMGSAIRNQFPV